MDFYKIHLYFKSYLFYQLNNDNNYNYLIY